MTINWMDPELEKKVDAFYPAQSELTRVSYNEYDFLYRQLKQYHGIDLDVAWHQYWSTSDFVKTGITDRFNYFWNVIRHYVSHERTMSDG